MRHCFLLLCVFQMLIGNLWAQSPWNLTKGQKYFQLNTSLISYRSLFYENSDEILLYQPITDFTLNLVGEYSFKDDFIVLARVPLKIYLIGEKDSNLPSTANPLNIEPGYFSAFGNVEVGIRKVLFNIRDYKLSTQVLVQFPTGSQDINRGLSTGYNAMALFSSLTLGKIFESFHFFLSTSIYFRNNRYSDGLEAWVEFGYRPLKKLLIMGMLDWMGSMENGNLTVPARRSLTGTFVNNQSYLAYGFKVNYELKDYLSLNSGFNGAIRGHFVAKSPSLNLGVSVKF
ncbi:hypothetical protein [Xanthovirga aplysinae]|uniref:hypothetical protein n=1 Tax=Xanthovirga aplysinae TaxID=2529853 RepID=UPI0012BB6157|nr:hypothetical protein [Xanthovirga aplysinae]MTI32125.1 hypothetical protein [Xanthovirga aplysinae]